MPWFAPVLWIALMGGIWRKRSGRWKRPNTFRWAMILMGLAIVLSTTGAVLEFYGK
jgi:hypothetical protein